MKGEDVETNSLLAQFVKDFKAANLGHEAKVIQFTPDGRTKLYKNTLPQIGTTRN